MPRIYHPVNCLDHQSNLVNNQEASPAMGPSFQGRWRLLATTDYVEIEESKGIRFFREIEELRQVYNLQSI